MDRLEPAPASAEGGFDLDAALDRVARWLPSQGPIKDFVHHNTLHAFEGMKFHEATAAAARLYGARSGMPPSYFLDAYRTGRISDSALDRALRVAYADEGRRAAARATMLSGRLEEIVFAGRARRGLRAAWTERLGGVALHRRSHLHLFRLFGGYLDQGLSTWPMPGAERAPFYDCVSALVSSSRLPLLPFGKGARALLALPAREALRAALVKTVGREDWYEPYLLETLLTQPGWTGLVHACERAPGLLLTPRRITLVDFVAVTLVAEVGCLERELGEGFAPLSASPSLAVEASPPDAAPERVEAERLLGVWQDAFEWSYYEPLLGALIGNAGRDRRRADPAKAWAIFCIDDRFSSVRRHLEELAPGVATFATAGFFG
ncbi:MAG: DUF2309 family protein, partial [Myxococcales bacterium]|nr:DUF2309 family protein [Myxococcales bacterium]